MGRGSHTRTDHKKCHLHDQNQQTRKITETDGHRGYTNDVHYNRHATGAHSRPAKRGRSRGQGGHYSQSRSSVSTTRGHNTGQYTQRNALPQRQRGTSLHRRENVTVRSDVKCDNCGSIHPPRQCRAYNKQCYACNKLGHFGKYCHSIRKSSMMILTCVKMMNIKCLKVTMLNRLMMNYKR